MNLPPSFPDVVTAGAVSLHPASHPCANFGTDRRFTDSIWPGIQTAVIKSRNKERASKEATGFSLADPRGALVAARRMNGIIRLPNADLVPSSLVP